MLCVEDLVVNYFLLGSFSNLALILSQGSFFHLEYFIQCSESKDLVYLN